MASSREATTARDAMTPRGAVDAAVLACAAFFGLTCPLYVFDPSVLFTYHPSAMATSFGLLMTLGVYASLKLRLLGHGPERVRAIWAHAAVQTFAVAFALGGFIAIYQNKNLRGKPHFATAHGKVGLVAVVLAVASPALGASAFARLGILTRLPRSYRPFAKGIHRYVGTAAYVAGLAATALALPHRSVDRGAVTIAWQCAVAVVALGTAFLAATVRPAVKTQTFKPSAA